MIDNKLILEHSKNLNILYVEDDEVLRNATKKIFINYFKHVDVAIDGKDGLEKFLVFKKENNDYYDLVISDINMPRMNGIEMGKAIMHENQGQSIIFITAHNEASFLHNAIEIGVNGFLTKPIEQNQLKIILYKTTQAINDRKLIDAFYRQVEELNMQLQEKNAQISEDNVKLEEQIKLLKTQVNATNVKHHQVEQLLQHSTTKTSEPLLTEYFTGDEDEGSENVLFISDNRDEMSEIFDEIPELLMQYTVDKNVDNIYKITTGLTKVSSILLRYTPFLDPLAESFEKLSSTINNNIELFVKILEEDSDTTMMLYDAVGIDMEHYMERFSIESMAMKNIHHIHRPTTLSIQQIIGMLSPKDIDEGGIEFF
ncbi:MAG: response regulator [Sulfurimonas sp.]|jgi:YesN/AraC family two-component response regulator